jgi:hypothetical protein
VRSLGELFDQCNQGTQLVEQFDAPSPIEVIGFDQPDVTFIVHFWAQGILSCVRRPSPLLGGKVSVLRN